MTRRHPVSYWACWSGSLLNRSGSRPVLVSVVSCWRLVGHLAAPVGGCRSVTARRAKRCAMKRALALIVGAGAVLPPGTVGARYAENFFLSGGVAPYTWSVAAGKLPPGLGLASTAGPADKNNQLAARPPQRAHSPSP